MILYPISSHSWRTILLVSLLMSDKLVTQAQSFAPVTTYSVGTFVVAADVTLVDVNRDGRVDIITANSAASSAGVLLNTGNGTFQPIARYSTGGNTYPQSVATADLNSDGFPDIVTANYPANSVSVLLNSGNGTFPAFTTFTTGSANAPYAVATGDINADGRPDIITANYNTNTVGLLLGNGNGTFQPIVTFSAGTGTNPQSVAVADVNGDGQSDVITGNYFGNSVGVLLNDGFGSFQPIVLYTTGNHTHRAIVSDVNADNRPDIISANFNNNSVGVHLGNGNGTFQTVSPYPIGPNQYSYGVAAADFNGDTKADLVAVNGSSNAAQVLLGNGNGTFQSLRSFTTGSGTTPNAVAVGDLNGDGKPDIVSANGGNNSVSVLLNTMPLATRSNISLPSFRLWPNPVSNGQPCYVAGTTSVTEARQLRVRAVNAVGASVYQATLPLIIGAVHQPLPEFWLPEGMYIFHISLCDGQGKTVGNLPAQRIYFK